MTVSKRCRVQILAPAWSKVMTQDALRRELPSSPFSRCAKVLVAVALALAGPLASAQAAANAAPQSLSALATVAALDVPRYMGKWFEIAKYPNRFQQQCVADTTADYQLQTNGKVQVTNRCRQPDGTFAMAVGEARQLGAPNSAKLEVRFAPAWLSLLPFVWGDYWVVDLDDAYQLVAVSEPRRDYLWVLSRTPSVKPEAYAALLGRLQADGFDLARLQLTKQGH